jgi:hypothetical protein
VGEYTLAQKNTYAYQIDFAKIKKVSKDKDVMKYYWDYDLLKRMFIELYQKDKNDIKIINSGWFYYLYYYKEYNESLDVVVNGIKKKEKRSFIMGKFLHAEYGSTADLRHADTLAKKKNNKGLREGEEKYVHFYVGSDGLLLLQGDVKLSRSRFETYFDELAKDFLKNENVNAFTVNTLLREDFIDEIDKLDQVSKIELELAIEKTTNFENEVMAETRQQAQEFDANYATITWQRKYKRDGTMKGYRTMLERFKPKGSDKPIKGVNNIKVIGKQSGDYKEVYLSKISEKYPLSVKLDSNNQVVSSDMYHKMKLAAARRERLWRSSDEVN